jgi:hypothetical protein
MKNKKAMKKLLTLVLLLISIQFYSQDFNKIASTELKVKEDYRKAEPQVSKSADFLFNNSNKPETNNRKIALAYIIQWMSGTSDHTFNIDSNAMELTKGNQDLFAMYMVALTKVCLDNLDKKLTDDDYFEKASQLLASYCSDKSNKLKPNKALKKVFKKMNKS